MASRRRATRVLLVLMLVLGLVVGLGSGPVAQAAPGDRVVCHVLASLNITGGPGAWQWDFVAGAGNCSGDGRGPYIASGSGSGTSDSLGFCDGLFVQNLSMDVEWDLFSLRDFQTYHKEERWFAPLTTFPIATPFFVDDMSGSLIGAGVLFNRFGGQCPPNGAPQSIIIEVRGVL